MARTLDKAKYMGMTPIVFEETVLGDKPWFYVRMSAVPVEGGWRGAGVKRFVINIGGHDYYASEEELDVAQATHLRDMLNAWLVQQ